MFTRCRPLRGLAGFCFFGSWGLHPRLYAVARFAGFAYACFAGSITRVRLRFGDVLLIQGNREQVERLAADRQILLLEEISEKHPRPERRWALLAFGVFVLLSLTQIVPLPIAVLLGVMILLASQSA